MGDDARVRTVGDVAALFGDAQNAQFGWSGERRYLFAETWKRIGEIHADLFAEPYDVGLYEPSRLRAVLKVLTELQDVMDAMIDLETADALMRPKLGSKPVVTRGQIPDAWR